MVHSVRLSSPQALSAAPALRALAAVAARLASDSPLDVVLRDVLEETRRMLDAGEVALWLRTATMVERRWAVGDDRIGPEPVRAALAESPSAEPPGTVVAPLVAGELRLGALAVRTRETATTEELLFIQTLADMLAPVIVHGEHARQLEVEVREQTRAIEHQRRFIEKIIDSLPVGLYVIDKDYRIQAWNRKRETGMQGVSREEAIGHSIFEILHRQPADLLRGEFDDVFATGRIQQFQTESTTTGDPRTYRISKIPMRLDGGAVTHVITIGEDVTEWREAQERTAQAEKLAAIGQLAAGIMHEINNPLATIAACAESLQMRLEDMTEAGAEVPPESHDYLKIVDAEVHRCKRIIDGLLDFARPKPVTKDRLDVNAVIDKTLFLLKHHSRFKKLTLNLDQDREMTERITANEEQLVQVFMALLMNAMDAMSERGSVTIRTRAVHTPIFGILTEIADTGHGIPRSELSKIFEPFYTTKAPGRGTGLGLSICYGIVAEHGGVMEVDSIPGKGSTFRVILPLGTSSSPSAGRITA